MHQLRGDERPSWGQQDPRSTCLWVSLAQAKSNVALSRSGERVGYSGQEFLWSVRVSLTQHAHVRKKSAPISNP